MIKTRKLGALLAGLAVTFAVATPALSSEIKSYNGHVERIFVSAAGTVHFRLKGDTCKAKPPAGNTYWTFKLGTPAEDAWYSMLLTAALSEKKVVARFGACDPGKSDRIWYIYVNR